MIQRSPEPGTASGLLEKYVGELGLVHASGAGLPETSYYVALAELLNAVGKTLKPRVRCIMGLKNRGAGNPDGGLFTPEQFQRAADADPLPGQLPSRGAIEAKPVSDDAWLTAAGQQVSGYWTKYRKVLVTNYRDFVLLGQDEAGQPVRLESYRLAESEAGFWATATHPRKLAQQHGQRFVEYLKRALLHGAPLATPADVAALLASYARDAKARVEAHEVPALATMRAALEEALGVRFEGARGQRFFRSTLVQTLFYGIFSAWVLWSKQVAPSDKAARFDWRTAAWDLRVPMIRALFERVAVPSMLGPLDLVEVLSWAGQALNRVDRAAFFSRFEQEHAVQYFYEPFLEAYDPELRKELGVWYTPPEIVQYMVARVDAVLRSELGVADGLADPRVFVLDPCCGTGAYLVEVLRKTAATLKQKGEDALLASDVKQAAMSRIFGLELLPAPFVVAHLQLGLLLQSLGAPLSDVGGERAGVYLTNALTGWEPPTGPKQHLLFPELEAERDAAERVKREVPILVVLGNPPYNAYAGVSPQEEGGLVEPYKEGLASKWGIKKYNLDDLYVRFFRLAERRIVEATGRGVVCYISNFSYLSDPSFVVMRKRLLAGFDSLWLDCLNGDSRETGKLTPEGKPDPSVFSTEHNREGIRLGTAIGLMIRKGQRDPEPTVRFRQFWGVRKRADLVESLAVHNLEGCYRIVAPDPSSRFSFRPSEVSSQYLNWPAVVDLCGGAPISGLQEMRRGALMSIDRSVLERRMRAYYDQGVDWQGITQLGWGLTEDTGSFNAKLCRQKVLAAERFDVERILRYALYPFDVRWCYHSQVPPLWNRPRPELLRQAWAGNRFIVTRMMAERPTEGIPLTVASVLPDYHLLRPNVVAIPTRLRLQPTVHSPAQLALLGGGVGPAANLSPAARAYLAALGFPDPDADAATAELVWLHVLAVGYSPAYLTENADGIRLDWPRIPLPDTRDALLASAALGRQLAALLDTEREVAGITSGTIRPELRRVAGISRVGGGMLDVSAGDLDIDVGWGHAGQGGVTMPGQGKAVERDYTAEERMAIEEGAKVLGLAIDQALQHLGETTLDVYLNDHVYWGNVPAGVWSYTIGGYQVIKKWLSYRERKLLGRGLTVNEAREVSGMARRVAAILLLEPQLDANYKRVKGATYAWPGSMDRA